MKLTHKDLLKLITDLKAQQLDTSLLEVVALNISPKISNVVPVLQEMREKIVYGPNEGLFRTAAGDVLVTFCSQFDVNRDPGPEPIVQTVAGY